MTHLVVRALAGSALYQDEGRRHLDSGVPTSGAFDRYAHAAATALVGGSGAQASLEVVGTIAVEADVAITCAVTGMATVTVAGREAVAWTALDVPAGAALEVDAQGRAYLAVAGGFQPREVLGSRSTCLLGPIGPAPVGIGDRLPLTKACTSPAAGDFIRPPRRIHAVRVIPGPHQRIAAGDVRVLEASRIGVRLTAGRLDAAAATTRSDLPSLGVLPGAVQILPSGDWMVLGPDAGTMGGYPVAGVVASADFDIWAHARPGDVVRLHVIGARDAPDPPIPAVVHVHGLGG